MILVTGATGLVGSHLVYRLLISGHHVRAIKRKNSATGILKKVLACYAPELESLFEQIEWVVADLTDPGSLEQALKGCEIVYHAAAMVSFVPSDKDMMYKINAVGTANLVKACLHLKIKKLCHVSSIAALGGPVNDSMVNEQTAWKPHQDISNYSLSKYYAEQEVWKGIKSGLDAVIVNPSVILGPGFRDTGSSALFFTVWKGLKFYTEGVTGFVDVRDVAEVMVRLTESAISGEKFIVSSENISYRDLFTNIARGLGKPEPKFKVTRLVASIAWRSEAIRCFFTGKTPLVTKETARSARKRNFYSNEKICSALNFKFIPVDESVRFISKLFLKEKSDR